VGLAIRDIVTESMREELTKQGISIAKNLSDRIANSVLLKDQYGVGEAARDVMDKEKDIEYVFATSANGEIFSHTFNDGHPPDLLRWNPLRVDQLLSVQLLDTEKGLIRDVGVRMFGGMNPELHIGIREERIRLTLNRIRNLIVMLTIVVTMIGSVLSFFLSRLTTKPLKTLVEFTHALSKGEFGKTITIRSRDEVGDLSETFNILSGELKSYQERMEETYRRMLRTEKLTALGRLSAGLAHEIRNPLTSIKVLFQTFKDNPGMTREDISVGLSAAEQMNDLITRFLGFARSDDFHPADVYLNPMLKQILHLTQFQIKNQGIDVSMDSAELPSVKGDGALIRQALLNLVLNAIEAMPSGGRLTISSRVENGKVSIAVGDTGAGIPENVKDKIFDPFFTTKSDGTGLGLSIVYNIARLHNGDIRFENNEGGTTFKLELPVGL